MADVGIGLVSPRVLVFIKPDHVVTVPVLADKFTGSFLVGHPLLTAVPPVAAAYHLQRVAPLTGFTDNVARAPQKPVAGLATVGVAGAAVYIVIDPTLCKDELQVKGDAFNLSAAAIQTSS